MTHTFVTLPISAAAYEEIKAKLIAAGYDHCIEESNDLIDLHEIALKKEEEAPSHMPSA